MWLRKLHSIGLGLDTRCEQDESTPLLDLLRAPLADSFESLWRFDSTLFSMLVLLTCGANPCARTERGRNALHVVSFSAYNIRRALKDANVFSSEAEHKILDFLSKCMTILCSFDCDIYHQTISGSTTRIYAQRRGYLQLWNSSLWYSGLDLNECPERVLQEHLAVCKENHSQKSSLHRGVRKRPGYSFQDEPTIPEIATGCKVL